MTSDTPRTNLLSKDERHLNYAETRYWCNQYLHLARQLERELAAAQAEIAAHKAEHDISDALLADAKAEIAARLPQAAVVAMQERYKAEIANLLEDAERDRARIAALRHVIDGVYGVDIHEEAMIHASHRGNDEPDENDYCAAGRTALDAAIDTARKAKSAPV